MQNRISTASAPVKNPDAFRSLEGASTLIAAKGNSRPPGNFDQESTSSPIEATRDSESTRRLLAEVQETSNVHQLEEFSFSGVDSRSNNWIDGNNSEDRKSDPSTTSSTFKLPSEHGSKAFGHREEVKMISEKRSFDGGMHSTLKDDPWEAYDIISGSDVVESWELLRQVSAHFTEVYASTHRHVLCVQSLSPGCTRASIRIWVVRRSVYALCEIEIHLLYRRVRILARTIRVHQRDSNESRTRCPLHAVYHLSCIYFLEPLTGIRISLRPS